jgi:hypothetical protein
MAFSMGTTLWRTKFLVSARIFEKSELSISLLSATRRRDNNRPSRLLQILSEPSANLVLAAEVLRCSE